MQVLTYKQRERESKFTPEQVFGSHTVDPVGQ